jgi:hypothetical protein
VKTTLKNYTVEEISDGFIYNEPEGKGLIGRLFLTMCWPRIEMCGACSFMRNFLVEVFAKVKVNLDLFKGNSAGKIHRLS